MFEIKKHGETSEVSFHENKNLLAYEKNTQGSSYSTVFLIDGAVDIETLQNAVHQLVLRHEGLRTRFFKNAAGQFSREVLTTSDVRVRYQNLAQFEVSDESVRRYISESALQRFNSFSYPLLQINLASVREEKSVLILTIADFLFDAASISIIIAELNVLYREQSNGGVDLPPMPYTLSDYVASHNAWLRSDDYANRLADLADKICNQVEMGGGAEQLFFESKGSGFFQIQKELSSAATQRIAEVTQATGVSAATYLGVTSAVLVAASRGTGGSFFTTSLSNRHYRHASKLVGFIATTMPFFMSMRPDETEVERLRRWHVVFMATMTTYGMMPILEIGNSVLQRLPKVPPGKSLKFGKVTINVRPPFELPTLGASAKELSLDSTTPSTNEFNFAYEAAPEGRVKLRLKGIEGNRGLAENFAERLCGDEATLS